MSEFYRNFTHWGCSSVKSQSSPLHMIMKFYFRSVCWIDKKKKPNQIQSNISRRCLTYKYLLDIKNVRVKLPVPQQCGFNQIRLSLSFDFVSLVCSSEELPMCIVQKKNLLSLSAIRFCSLFSWSHMLWSSWQKRKCFVAVFCLFLETISFNI